MNSPLRPVAGAMAVLATPTCVLAEAQVAGAPAPDIVLQDEDEASTRNLSVSLGASRWSGDFGAPDNSTISAVLPTVRYGAGGLRLTASIPWMRINSRGAIFTGIDGAPLIVSPDAATSPRVRDGIGDLTLGAAYQLSNRGAGGVDVDLIAKVKLPTGSTKRGVSTGKTDYVLGAEISRAVGAFTPSVAVRYRDFGNAKGWRLKDGLAASVGGAYQ